ncbi:MAG: SHOCT domain-containing protein [Parahaliea sp.]
MLNKTLVGSLIVVSAMALGACSGGDSSIKQTTQTQGQQLLDLKEAYDKGVITEKEYERTKKQILKGK